MLWFLRMYHTCSPFQYQMMLNSMVERKREIVILMRSNEMHSFLHWEKQIAIFLRIYYLKNYSFELNIKLKSRSNAQTITLKLACDGVTASILVDGNISGNSIITYYTLVAFALSLWLNIELMFPFRNPFNASVVSFHLHLKMGRDDFSFYFFCVTFRKSFSPALWVLTRTYTMQVANPYKEHSKRYRTRFRTRDVFAKWNFLLLCRYLRDSPKKRTVLR